MRQTRFLGFALAALLAGCASPDREAQNTAIQADVSQTFGGDVGALIYHGYEAAREGEAADKARTELASQPSYLAVDSSLSDQAMTMADESAEHRRQAEAALNRILDPLRDRIAKLEQNQQATVPEVTTVLHFAPGSAALPASETAKLQAVAHYLARHPHASVTITGWSDTTGGAKANRDLSRARANAVYDALNAHGLPLDTQVAVIGAGAAGTEGGDPIGRRVKIEVRPLG
jgi:outer membrane protein OmpA-like peptidoglycan-associated protein